MKRMKTNICVIALFTLLPALLMGQGDEGRGPDSLMSLSLDQAVEMALERNDSVRIAELNITQADQKVWETTAIGLPQVSASASYQMIIGDIPVIDFTSDDGGGGQMAIPDGVTPEFAQQFGLMFGNLMGSMIEPKPIANRHSGSASLTVSQLIFSGEYIIGLQAARVYRSLSTEAKEQTGLQISESVSNIYILILILENNKLILDSMLSNLEEMAYETQQMYEAGFVEETDADQVRLTAANIKNSIATLETQIKLTKYTLLMKLNLPITQPLELSSTIEDIVNAEEVSKMLAAGFDVEKSIFYQMTQTQVELQELSVKREKSTYLPTLSAFYQHQEQFNAPDFNFVMPDLVGVQLQVPIFSSGQRYKRVQQAQIELEKAKITQQTVDRALNIEYQSLLDLLNTSWSKAQLEKDNMRLAKRIYERTQIKFNEGFASSLELTQAQNQYLETQSNYFSAMLEVLRARNKMKRLMEDQAN